MQAPIRTTTSIERKGKTVMSIRGRVPGLLLLASLAAAGAALAHGTAKHVMGTATAVEAGRLEVKTREGESVTLDVREETKFRDKGGAGADPAELRVGDRVVVDFHVKDDAKIADEIRFAHPEEVRP